MTSNQKKIVFFTFDLKKPPCLYIKEAAEKLKIPYCFYPDSNSATQQEADNTVVGGVTFFYGTPDFSRLDLFPNLKTIAHFGKGTDNVDQTLLKSRNINMMCLQHETTEATAETGILLLLNSARRVSEVVRQVKCGEFNRDAYRGSDLSGKVIGVVGLGNIGSEIARKAQLAFNMKVVYHQRNKRSDTLYPYFAKLDEMLPNCDFVLLACPLSPQTNQMISRTQLKLMKRSAHLINIGRGKLVNTDDLVEALRHGEISGAGLDVTDPEPIPANHPLVHLPNAFVLPHIGTWTDETMQKMALGVLDNLNGVLNA